MKKLVTALLVLLFFSSAFSLIQYIPAASASSPPSSQSNTASLTFNSITGYTNAGTINSGSVTLSAKEASSAQTININVGMSTLWSSSHSGYTYTDKYSWSTSSGFQYWAGSDVSIYSLGFYGATLIDSFTAGEATIVGDVTVSLTLGSTTYSWSYNFNNAISTEGPNTPTNPYVEVSPNFGAFSGSSTYYGSASLTITNVYTFNGGDYQEAVPTAGLITFSGNSGDNSQNLASLPSQSSVGAVTGWTYSGQSASAGLSAPGNLAAWDLTWSAQQGGTNGPTQGYYYSGFPTSISFTQSGNPDVTSYSISYQTANAIESQSTTQTSLSSQQTIAENQNWFNTTAAYSFTIPGVSGWLNGTPVDNKNWNTVYSFTVSNLLLSGYGTSPGVQYFTYSGTYSGSSTNPSGQYYQFSESNVIVNSAKSITVNTHDLVNYAPNPPGVTATYSGSGTTVNLAVTSSEVIAGEKEAITVQWAPGVSNIYDVSQGTNTFTYAYGTPGDYTIGVTVSNIVNGPSSYDLSAAQVYASYSVQIQMSPSPAPGTSVFSGTNISLQYTVTNAQASSYSLYLNDAPATSGTLSSNSGVINYTERYPGAISVKWTVTAGSISKTISFSYGSSTYPSNMSNFVIVQYANSLTHIYNINLTNVPFGETFDGLNYSSYAVPSYSGSPQTVLWANFSFASFSATYKDLFYIGNPNVSATSNGQMWEVAVYNNGGSFYLTFSQYGGSLSVPTALTPNVMYSIEVSTSGNSVSLTVVGVNSISGSLSINLPATNTAYLGHGYDGNFTGEVRDFNLLVNGSSVLSKSFNNNSYTQEVVLQDPLAYGLNAQNSNFQVTTSSGLSLYTWIQSENQGNQNNLTFWTKTPYSLSGSETLNLRVMPAFESMLSSTGYLGEAYNLGPSDNGVEVFPFYRSGINNWENISFTGGGTWNITNGILQQTNATDDNGIGIIPTAYFNDTNFSVTSSYSIGTSFSYTTDRIARVGVETVITPAGFLNSTANNQYLQAGYAFVGQNGNNNAGFLSMLANNQGWLYNGAYEGQLNTQYQMLISDAGGTWSGTFGFNGKELASLPNITDTAANRAGYTNGYAGMVTFMYNASNGITYGVPASYNYFFVATQSVMPTASVSSTGQSYQANTTSGYNVSRQSYSYYTSYQYNQTLSTYNYVIQDSFNANYIQVNYNASWTFVQASYQNLVINQAQHFILFKETAGVGQIGISFLENALIGNPTETSTVSINLNSSISAFPSDFSYKIDYTTYFGTIGTITTSNAYIQLPFESTDNIYVYNNFNQLVGEALNVEIDQTSVGLNIPISIAQLTITFTNAQAVQIILSSNGKNTTYPTTNIIAQGYYYSYSSQVFSNGSLIWKNGTFITHSDYDNVTVNVSAQQAMLQISVFASNASNQGEITSSGNPRVQMYFNGYLYPTSTPFYGYIGEVINVKVEDVMNQLLYEHNYTLNSSAQSESVQITSPSYILSLQNAEQVNSTKSVLANEIINITNKATGRSYITNDSVGQVLELYLKGGDYSIFLHDNLTFHTNLTLNQSLYYVMFGQSLLTYQQYQALQSATYNNTLHLMYLPVSVPSQGIDGSKVSFQYYLYFPDGTQLNTSQIRSLESSASPVLTYNGTYYHIVSLAASGNILYANFTVPQVSGFMTFSLAGTISYQGYTYSIQIPGTFSAISKTSTGQNMKLKLYGPSSGEASSNLSYFFTLYYENGQPFTLNDTISAISNLTLQLQQANLTVQDLKIETYSAGTVYFTVNESIAGNYVIYAQSDLNLTSGYGYGNDWLQVQLLPVPTPNVGITVTVSAPGGNQIQDHTNNTFVLSYQLDDNRTLTQTQTLSLMHNTTIELLFEGNYTGTSYVLAYKSPGVSTFTVNLANDSTSYSVRAILTNTTIYGQTVSGHGIAAFSVVNFNPTQNAYNNWLDGFLTSIFKNVFWDVVGVIAIFTLGFVYRKVKKWLTHNKNARELQDNMSLHDAIVFMGAVSYPTMDVLIARYNSMNPVLRAAWDSADGNILRDPDNDVMAFLGRKGKIVKVSQYDLREAIRKYRATHGPQGEKESMLKRFEHDLEGDAQ